MTEALSAPTIEQALTGEVERKIQAKYHTYFGYDPERYKLDFRFVIRDAVKFGRPQNGKFLALVDPRIPFTIQAKLLGIGINPAVFSFPQREKGKEPYFVWLNIVNPNNLTPHELRDALPPHFRPATPFEGINGPVEEILKQKCVQLPGNDSNQHRNLVLENWFGKSRITHQHVNDYDDSVGMLVAYREPRAI